jgi:hypothetical protein
MIRSITITKDGTTKHPWTVRYPHEYLGKGNNYTRMPDFKSALHYAADLREAIQYYKHLEILVMDEDGVFVIEDDNAAMTALLMFE